MPRATTLHNQAGPSSSPPVDSAGDEADQAEDQAGEHLARWRHRVVDRSLERARQRSIERGESFIQAARQLLDATDGAGFTVQQVADAAGQSLRTFYQHFRSKDDLLLAVFEEGVIRAAEEYRAEVARHDLPIARLAALLIAAASAARATPRGGSVGMAHYRMHLAESHPEEIAVVQRPMVALFEEVLAEAVAAGAIPPCDVEKAAYLLITLKTAYIHSDLLGNELGVALPTPVELARFCLEGLNATLPSDFG